MNISMTGRKIELTDAIKTHLNASIESLNKFNIDIISANIVVESTQRKSKEHFVVEFTLNLAHKGTVVIKQRDEDLHAAIDLVTDRAQKALRRIHDREVDHQKVGLNAVKAESNGKINMSEAKMSEEDEIIPVELDLYKPREVEDVLEDLKSSDKIFEIFIDNAGKTRVLYKRNDGKFGLY
jgi:putative sigma-54 modulation protein